MHSSWTNGLEKQQAEDMKTTVKYSGTVLSRLVDILEKEISISERDQLSRDYSDASWAYKQADYIGQQRSYAKVLTIIKSAIKE